MANSVVHFEVPAHDMERAKTFYHEVFGWQIKNHPELRYHSVTTAEVGPDMSPVQPGTINGGLFDRAEFPITAPVITIGVDDIDEALKMVEKAGGTILKGREAVADMGFTGYFTDPEGNVMGLWQNAPAA